LPEAVCYKKNQKEKKGYFFHTLYLRKIIGIVQ
jgi:hypothetical protein